MRARTYAERADDALFQDVRRLVDAAAQLRTAAPMAADKAAMRRKAISVLTDLNDVLADLRMRRTEIEGLLGAVVQRTTAICAYVRTGGLTARRVRPEHAERYSREQE